MVRGNGHRLLDWLLITAVLIAVTWFLQRTPPTVPVMMAIVIAAAGLAIWVPNRKDAAASVRLPGLVLFGGAVLGFVAGGQAFRMAGEASSGGLLFAFGGVACYACSVAMLRMLGWRAQNGASSGAVRA